MVQFKIGYALKLFKIRILVQGRGGAAFKTAGMHQHVEDFRPSGHQALRENEATTKTLRQKTILNQLLIKKLP